MLGSAGDTEGPTISLLSSKLQSSWDNWVPTVYWVRGFWALGPRAGIGDGVITKGSQIHRQHKHYLHIFILFLSRSLCDKYLLSVHMHAWWDNVLDMSVNFSKAFGCSCNRLNINPFKGFSGFVMSYYHWVFSQSMDARNSLLLWNYMERVNILKGFLNIRKHGDFKGKLTQVHNNTRCGACRRAAQRL